MNEHGSLLDTDENNILKAVLPTAFTPPQSSLHHSHRRPNMPSIPNKTDSPVVETAPVNLASEESASQSTDDLWKAEYEAQVQSWRAQSAEAREKAEKERARWEAIRAAEKTEANRLAAQVHDSEHGWETVGPKSTSDPSSSQQTTSQLRDLADAGDPVLGASQALQAASQTKTDPSLVSRQDTCDDNKLSSSQKWEDLHSSQTSSFPSLSFPDNPDTPSPEHQHTSNASPPPTAAPASVTLAIFDPTLPARTRVSALLSSLAINLLLPFVNGVMLGFGEIFAKNVVMGWFGWKIPGTVAGNVGVGIKPRSENRRRMS